MKEIHSLKVAEIQKYIITGEDKERYLKLLKDLDLEKELQSQNGSIFTEKFLQDVKTLKIDDQGYPVVFQTQNPNSIYKYDYLNLFLSKDWIDDNEHLYSKGWIQQGNTFIRGLRWFNEGRILTTSTEMCRFLNTSPLERLCMVSVSTNLYRSECGATTDIFLIDYINEARAFCEQEVKRLRELNFHRNEVPLLQ